MKDSICILKQRKFKEILITLKYWRNSSLYYYWPVFSYLSITLLLSSVTSYDSNQFKKKEPTRGEEEKGATMDMYHEEINMQGEIDALAMVLQQHRQEKAASQENVVPSETQNGHVQSNDLNASYVNEGFDLHFETTEV